jgi:endonuclease YncB( thermonuclease family)
MPRARFSALRFSGRNGWRGHASPRHRAGRKARRGGGRLSPILVMLPLAAFTAVFAWEGPPPAASLPIAGTPAPLPRGWDVRPADLDAQQPDLAAARASGGDTGAGVGGPDAQRARFAVCGGGARVDCVVDGDTFWYGGAKIRIADINTPELGEPKCAREAALAQRATARLTALLNQGAFTLEPTDRATDRYGRALRVVTRGGESLGGVLVAEGLAEEWRGYRGEWC